jgi:hypothetical protein
LRYDVRLELDWIEKELGEEVEAVFGRKLTEVDVIRMRSMDDPTIIHDIYRLAQIAAKKQVKAEHWLGDFACWCDGKRPAAKVRTMKPPKDSKPLPADYVAWYHLATSLSYLRSKFARRGMSSTNT